MKDAQRKFWLDDEVQWAKTNSFIWGIVYGTLSAAVVTLSYEWYTGYPAFDLLMRLFGDNRM